MKKFGLLLMVFLVAVSCFKDTDDEIFIDSPLVGTWKHFETIDDIIEEEEEETGNHWQSIENGRTMILKNDGSFSKLTNSCSSGTYIINSETISYTCDTTDPNEVPLVYRFEGEFLIISSGFVAEKFRKIVSEDD